MRGINIGIISSVKKVKGVSITGLFNKGQGLEGISITGLVNGHSEKARGIVIGGMTTMAIDGIHGLGMGLLVWSFGTSRGALISPYILVADKMNGMAISPLTAIHTLQGTSVSGI